MHFIAYIYHYNLLLFHHIKLDLTLCCLGKQTHTSTFASQIATTMPLVCETQRHLTRRYGRKITSAGMHRTRCLSVMLGCSAARRGEG